MRGIPWRIVAIVVIRVIPRRVTETDPDREPAVITVPETPCGIRVITQVKIIQGRPGIISNTGIDAGINNIGRVIFGVINTVFECCFRIIISYTAR